MTHLIKPTTSIASAPRPMTYRRQLVLIGLITVVMMSAGWMGLLILERRLITASGETIATLATAVASNIDLLSDQRYRDVQTMAALVASSSVPPAVIEVFRRTHPSYLWIGLVDRTGHVSYATDPSTIGRDVRQSEWYVGAQGPAGAFVGDARPDQMTQGFEAIAFSAAIDPPSRPAGEGVPVHVLSARLGFQTVEGLITDAIQSFQRRAGMFPEVEYQIVREDGSVFIDSDFAHKGQVNLKQLGVSSLALAASGAPGFVEEDHLRRQLALVTGYARTRARGSDAGLGWTVLIRVDRAAVLAPITPLIWTVGGAAVLLALPLIGLLIRATHKAHSQWGDAEDERSRSRRNARRLQTILEVDPEGVLVLGCDRGIVQVNPAGCALFAAAFPEEVLGRDLITFIHPDDRHGFDRVHHVAVQGRSAVAKGRLIGLSGQVRWIEMTSVLLPDDGDAEPAVLGVVRDVTEQRRGDRRQALQHAVANVLAESSAVDQALPELLRVVTTALEGQVGLFWMVRADQGIVRCLNDWSPVAAMVDDFVKASRREAFASGVDLPGRCWARGEPLWVADVFKESAFSRGPAAAVSALHTGCAFPIWLRASVYGVMECFSRDVQAPDPDLLRTLGIIGSQIGLFIERTEVEAALRENESRTRLIIDTALDAVITMDSAGVVTEWNAQAEQMFGWSSHEVIGRDLAETIIPPARQEAYRQGLARYLHTGRSPMMGRLVEWTARHRDGREFPVEISMAPLRLDGAVIFSAFIRNIASRKEAEQSLTSYAQRLEQSNRELDVALAQAQAATEAKSAFLATMSHEIRTPMNGIIGMTGLLLDTELTPEQLEYSQTVRQCGDHLLMLINDILDFSKIEAGKLSLEMIPFDPRSAIEESLRILAERASSKGLNLASLFRADVPRALLGDPGRLRQIVMNLVGNAIKFTERGEVVIQVALDAQTEQDATLRITVSDSGIGIAEDVQQRLFQSFSQADGSTTRKYGGTGLGLAICKRLVELMRGAIGVTSRPGEGSCFWFTVRLGKPPEVPVPAAPSSGALGGVRVLIVGDKGTNRTILEQLTRRWGMEPTVIDGEPALLEFLDVHAETPPCDMALLDVDMQADEAVQLARTIRGRPNWTALRVVLMTAVGRRGDAGTAREAGLAGYLTKPIREAELYDGLIAVMKAPPPGFATAAEDTAPPLVTRHSLAEAKANAGLRILLAEDNIINQKVAVHLFERLGYRVDVAANGLEAVEALASGSYGLVFMDGQMPHMDGLQATREIRTREAGVRRTPIVAMTANAMQGDRERCLAAGMDDYVSKPITREAVIQVLERLRPMLADGPASGGDETPAISQSIDWLIFNELRELAGAEAPDFLTTLVGHFLRDTPASLAGMERALETDDLKELARLAHRLKGSAGHLGALRMTHCCEQIQTVARDGRPAGACAPWVRELKRDFVQVQASLAEELGRLQPQPRPLGPAATI